MQREFKSALVIAPYSPIGRGQIVHLGAARKIEFVIEMLHGIADRVTLINSSHNSTNWEKTRMSRLRLAEAIEIDEYIPFELPSRPIGKLFNLLFIGGPSEYFSGLNPDLVWLYNGHAFECRMALRAKAKSRDFKLVIEIEDTHHARSRGFSIKPFLDDTYLRKALEKTNLITLINEAVGDQYQHLNCEKLPFPGSVATELLEVVTREPFTGQGPCNAGYFGGLEAEKGADVLLEAIRQSPLEGWKFLVCGRGSMKAAFEKLAVEFPERLELHSDLSARSLYELFNRVDVIINPHRSIEKMGDGVFPFKVIEALAAGRIVISTPLPVCKPDVTPAILEFDGSALNLSMSLVQIKLEWEKYKPGLNLVRKKLIDQYSVEGVGKKIAALLRSDSFVEANGG